jgi:hypothetical protein
MLLLLNLLQAPQRGLSWTVIIAAVIALIVAISLVVYFYRRYKVVEKEAEEDWDSSRRSLFVNVAPPAPSESVSVAQPDKPAVEEVVEARGTR